MHIKHPQFILGFRVTEQNIKALKECEAPTGRFFADVVQNDLIIAQRNQLDGNGQELKGDPSIRQILPYFSLKKEFDGVIKTFLYQRTKKVGEERLGGRYSVGFGGHIDLSDVCFDKTSVIDLIDTINLSTKREFSEEITLEKPQDHPKLLVGLTLEDPGVTCRYILLDDEVGRLHCGIAFDIYLDTVDGDITLEDELTPIGWKTSEELKEYFQQCEPWTQLLINEMG